MAHSHDATSPEVHAGLQRLIHAYQTLEEGQLEALRACYASEARFKDPFNDVQGAAAIVVIFDHMFSTVEAPRFVVTQHLMQGQSAFLAWEFHFRMRRWRKGVAQVIRGGTLLQFDKHGLVQEHRDFWDAAEELYEKLPVIGVLMRFLRRAGAA